MVRQLKQEETRRGPGGVPEARLYLVLSKLGYHPPSHWGYTPFRGAPALGPWATGMAVPHPCGGGWAWGGVRGTRAPIWPHAFPGHCRMPVPGVWLCPQCVILGVCVLGGPGRGTSQVGLPHRGTDHQDFAGVGEPAAQPLHGLGLRLVPIPPRSPWKRGGSRPELGVAAWTSGLRLQRGGDQVGCRELCGRLPVTSTFWQLMGSPGPQTSMFTSVTFASSAP